MIGAIHTQVLKNIVLKMTKTSWNKMILHILYTLNHTWIHSRGRCVRVQYHRGGRSGVVAGPADGAVNVWEVGSRSVGGAGEYASEARAPSIKQWRTPSSFSL